MPQLESRAAIVSGGTSGMGRAIAGLFAAEGASVIIGGRDPSRGAQVVAEIRARGGRCEFVPGDVCVPATSEALVKRALESFGSVDSLVANAGKLGLGSVTGTSLELWHDTIATNLHSVFYLMRAAIPEMQKRDGGTIVVNGSIAAFKGFPKHAAYCASKAALTALVRQVAVDYAPDIRANLICPGPVDTPLLWESAAAFPDPSRAVADAERRTALGRLGQPADVARAALFLAGPASSWITGASLTVDGGINCS
jgi:NAD(P)-dependent dehydrogenase (short-subunit alcohol dehydrogenase family)